MNTRVKELIRYVNKDSSGKWLSFEDAEELSLLLYRDIVARIEGAKVLNQRESIDFKNGYNEGLDLSIKMINGAFGKE
jgi:hypothetical protein